MQVLKKWPKSAEVNLSNPSRNRQAWIGQASCCYYYGVPEYATKYGWRLLSANQQAEANKVADKIIATWEKKMERKGYAKTLSEY